MSVTAHPSLELVAAYANGTLPAAPGLVVAAHLERCPRCRAQVATYEAVAGEMLATLAPAHLDAQALTTAIDRLDDPHPPEDRQGGRPLPHLPAAIAAAGVRARRWFGLGRWVAPVGVARADGWRVFLLHGPAGARMPLHAHTGPEVTCVLQGAYRDGPTTYRPGDFSEAASDVRHRIEVTVDGPCLVIIARQGAMRTGPIMTVMSRILGV